MAGFSNGIVAADNVDFSGGAPVAGQVTTDGQLLIGSTASPNIKVGTLTSTGATITITPGSGTINLESAGGSGGQPITDYVVDPSGGGDYTTIQAAMTQANTDGGGSVWVRPGAYAEDLTFYGDVSLVGAAAVGDTAGLGAVITGTHTPPTSGRLEIRNIGFEDGGTTVFSSASAGSAVVIIEDCWCNLTTGSDLFLDLANWTGTIYLIGQKDGPAADYRIVDVGSGSSDVYIMNSQFPRSGGATSSVAGNLYVSDTVGGRFTVQGASTSSFLDNSSLYTFANNNSTAAVEARNCSFGAYTHGAGTSTLFGCTVSSTTAVGVNGGTFTAYDSHFETTFSNANCLNLFGGSTVANLYNCTLIPDGTGNTIGYLASSASTFSLNNCSVKEGAVPNTLQTQTYEASMPGGGVGWNEETGTSAQMVNNWGYVANNGTGITLTLPAASNVGDIIEVVGKGSANWVVAQNAGQTIHNVASTSTTGVTGTLAPTEPEATVRMVCITKNTDYRIVSSTGTIVLT